MTMSFSSNFSIMLQNNLLEIIEMQQEQLNIDGYY